MADKDNVYDIGIGTSIDSKDLKKELSKAESQIKSFASEASKSLTGVDFTKLLVPTAIAGTSIAALTKLKGALDDMAAAYREQEQAEIALKNAAKNNPYLNDRSVKQLISFADEMQKVTGLDNVMVTQTQTRLASLGRNQQQIQSILKTAADMAAAGVMDFDSAVSELNNSLNGVVRTSGRLYPELKNLSKEALASGQAIEIIGQKVAGSAAEATKTGTGSVTAYKNAIGDLKKLYGEDWEKATKGFRVALTNYIERVVEAKKATNEYKEMLKILKSEGKNANTEVRLYFDEEAYNEITKDIMLLYTQLNEAQQEYNDFLGKEADYDKELFILQKKLHQDAIADINRQINLKKAEKDTIEKNIDARKELIGIEESIETAVKKTGQVYGLVGEDNIRSLEANNVALKAQVDLKAAIKTLDVEAARDAQKRAEAAVKIAEQEELIFNSTQKAKESREEIEKALALEIEKIERKAALDGKSVESLEVQRQILDAQTSAYENILSATRDILDNAPEEKQALEKRLDLLRQEFERQRELAKTDEERKKALADLAKMQEEIQSDVTRIYDLGQEQLFQEQLAEIRKKSITEAVEYEQAYRTKGREIEKNNKLREMEDEFNIAVQSTQLTEDEKIKLEQDYLNARLQLDKNYADHELIIEKDNIKAIEQAHLEMYQRLMAAAQEYLNAASSIASSISTIWTNNIDYETNEKLKANDKLIQSDEERADAEKKIQIEAAYERYKAELFAWTANVNMAMANMAMSMMTAYQKGLEGGFGLSAPATAALFMGLAAASGGMNVAAVISARPKPPRFHTGGVVQGSGEQSAVLKGGEVVQTQRQFQNTMQAINNLASAKTGGGGVQMNVKVENNASNKVSAEPQMTADGFKVVIKEIVNEGFTNGSFDRGLAKQQSNIRGVSLI